MKTLFKRLFPKKCPPCPAFRPQDSIGTSYRSFSTPAQIKAYSDAREDRLAFRDGRVNDWHISEPGVTPQLAFLDLSDDPAVDWDSLGFDSTVPGKRL